MKEIFKTIIKEHSILLFGTGLFTYGLFSFDSGRYCDEAGGMNIVLFQGCDHPATFYYYDDLTLILLVIGVIFMAIGLLKIRRKRSDK